MKTLKTTLLISLLLLVGMSSCTITKRRYTGGWHVEWKHRKTTGHDPVARQQEQTLPETEIAPSIAPMNDEEIKAPVTDEALQATSNRNEASTFTAETENSPATSKPEINAPASRISEDTVERKVIVKREKWVPLKYRMQEKRKRPNEPGERSGWNRSPFTIVLTIIGTIMLVVLGLELSAGLAALCIVIFDFTVGLSFIAYYCAFLLAWITSVPVIFLLLKMYESGSSSLSRESRRKRNWKLAFLISAVLAICIVVLLFLFL